MLVKALPLVCAATLVAAAAQAAQPAYTMADVTACSKDAMRFCRGSLPDLNKVESCMKANIDRLRPACRARLSQAR